jgi:hypothetical protein
MKPTKYGGLALCLALAALCAATHVTARGASQARNPQTPVPGTSGIQFTAAAESSAAAPQVTRQVLYVNAAIGDDALDGLCPALEGGSCGPKRTIQAGLDAAAEGDEVVVADGIYTGSGNYDLDFQGKAITLHSASGDPANCLIDCARAGRGFFFHSGETNATVVDGFTIANGFQLASEVEMVERRGGGILCTNGSSPTLANCDIRACESWGADWSGPYMIPGGGGGLAFLDQSHPAMVDCLIELCIVRNGIGGGILCDASSPTITDCIITGCSAGQDYYEYADFGGGLACLNGSNPTLTLCNIDNNTAQADGAGVYCRSSAPSFIDCTISGNTIADSSGRTGGLACYYGDPTLHNCTIAGNEGYLAGGIYCDHSSPLLRACTITDNGGQYASGMLCEWYSYPELTACRIVAGWNTSSGWEPEPPAAILCRGASSPTLSGCLIDDAGGLWAQSYGYPVVRNCTLAGSVVSSHSSEMLLQSSIAPAAVMRAYTLAGSPAQLSISYCDVQGGQAAIQVDAGSTLLWGAGNIDADPAFVAPAGPDGDPATWEDNDFHLSAGSPCINAGVPGYVPQPGETDIDGQLRVWQGRVDIGADEFGAPGAGDLNCDGAVNVFDIDPFVLALTDAAGYAGQYPTCNRDLADLNRDGLVNAFDIDPFVSRLTGGQGDDGRN